MWGIVVRFILSAMILSIKIARSVVLVGCTLAHFSLAGCGGDEQVAQQGHPGGSPADAPGSSPAGQAAASAAGTAPSASATGHGTTGHGTTLAGVTFVPPGNWQDLGPSGMRQAQYQLAPVSGDAAPAEVNVFYFGPQSGGGVDANLQRWIGQMILPDGSDPAASVQHSAFTADGMPGHLISLDGSYKSGGGRPMGGEGAVLPGYRLVGVVLEGPQGSVFFKLTGPVATARAMESDLLAMVKAAHR